MRGPKITPRDLGVTKPTSKIDAPLATNLGSLLRARQAAHAPKSNPSMPDDEKLFLEINGIDSLVAANDPGDPNRLVRAGSLRFEDPPYASGDGIDWKVEMIVPSGPKNTYYQIVIDYITHSEAVDGVIEETFETEGEAVSRARKEAAIAADAFVRSRDESGRARASLKDVFRYIQEIENGPSQTAADQRRAKAFAKKLSRPLKTNPVYKDKEEATQALYRLLADPDPGSMVIAEDLVRENDLKLDELGARMARESEIYEPQEWPDPKTRRETSGIISHGGFVLSPATELAVFWWVAHLGATAKYGVYASTLAVMKVSGAVYPVAGGSSDEPLLLSGGPGLVAENRTKIRNTVLNAWEVAKYLKQRHGGATREELERLASGTVRYWEDPALHMVNPARSSKPAKFRPSKVVAKFEKDTRPSFDSPVASHPAQLIAGLSDYLGDRPTEYFVVLFISIRNQIIGYTEFTEGNVAGVTVHVSGIFRDALASGAAAILTVHQHPSGNPVPSDEDRALWHRIDAVGELMGIPTLDHMVVTADTKKYFSRVEHNAP